MHCGYLALVVATTSTTARPTWPRRCGAQVVSETQPGYGAGARRDRGGVDAGPWRCSTATGRWIPGICHPRPRNSIRGATWRSAGASLRQGCVGRGTPGSAMQQCAGRLRRPPWPSSARHRAQRVASRDAVLALGVTDRRSGYPLELLVVPPLRTGGWSSTTVTYGPRTGASPKVSGSVRGSFIAGPGLWRRSRDSDVLWWWRRLPVPGLAKTRLAATIGDAAAAGLRRRRAIGHPGRRRGCPDRRSVTPSAKHGVHVRRPSWARCRARRGPWRLRKRQHTAALPSRRATANAPLAQRLAPADRHVGAGDRVPRRGVADSRGSIDPSRRAPPRPASDAATIPACTAAP